MDQGCSHASEKHHFTCAEDCAFVMRQCTTSQGSVCEKVYICVCLAAALVWYGSHRREWKPSVHFSVYLARKLQFIDLFLHLVFFNEPEQKQRETAGIRSALSLQLGVTKSVERDIVPSVLQHCWSGDRKGIRPVKHWVLVCCGDSLTSYINCVVS